MLTSDCSSRPGGEQVYRDQTVRPSREQHTCQSDLLSGGELPPAHHQDHPVHQLEHTVSVFVTDLYLWRRSRTIHVTQVTYRLLSPSNLFLIKLYTTFQTCWCWVCYRQDLTRWCGGVTSWYRGMFYHKSNIQIPLRQKGGPSRLESSDSLQMTMCPQQLWRGSLTSRPPTWCCARSRCWARTTNTSCTNSSTLLMQVNQVTAGKRWNI